MALPPSAQHSNPHMVRFLISFPYDARPTECPPPKQTLKRTKFWWRVIGRALSTLLSRSSYSEGRRAEYDDFFRSSVAPLLGPTPDEYSSSPVSLMCDDHTPVEIGWVFKSTGETSVQYALDALSPTDGTPFSPEQNLLILQSLAIAGQCQGFDMTWTRKCTKSLLWPSKSLPQDLQRVSQFFIGSYPRSVVNPKPPFTLSFVHI
jgi:DMATS type aromatic prenyltransferase